MPQITSDDADIFYEVLGSGAPVVLLHPFPANHELWKPAAQALISHYRVILPDLRGHGDSSVGEGPAVMEKHTEDLVRVLDHADVGRVPFVGVSIGGYVLFEFWRRFGSRVQSLVLCNTKAQADAPEARAARLQASVHLLSYGIGPLMLLQLMCYPALLLFLGRHGLRGRFAFILASSEGCLRARQWMESPEQFKREAVDDQRSGSLSSET